MIPSSTSLSIGTSAPIFKGNRNNGPRGSFYRLETFEKNTFTAPRRSSQATVSNLSTCWLMMSSETLVSHNLAQANCDDNCVILAPGQTYNISLEDNNFFDTVTYAIIEPPETGEYDCDDPTYADVSGDVFVNAVYYTECPNNIKTCTDQLLICPPDILATDRLYPSGVTPTGALPCGGDTTTGATGAPTKYICDCDIPTISYTESFAAGHWYWGDGPPPIIPPATAAASCTYTILRDWSITDTCTGETCPQIIHVDRSIIPPNIILMAPLHVVGDCADDYSVSAIGQSMLFDTDTDMVLSGFSAYDCPPFTRKNADDTIEYLCGFTASTGPRVIQRTFFAWECDKVVDVDEAYNEAYQRITLLCSGCTATTLCDNFKYTISKLVPTGNTATTINYLENIVDSGATYEFTISGSSGTTYVLEFDGSDFLLDSVPVTIPIQLNHFVLEVLTWYITEYNGVPVSAGGNTCIRIVQ